MQSNVTMTLKQLSVLRLMLRLQKLRTLRSGMQKYKAGTHSEQQAVVEILEKHDLLNGVDIGLMITEHAAVQSQVGIALIRGGGTLNPSTPVNFLLEDSCLKVCKLAADCYYSADGSLGSQAEQAEALQVIAEEAEGLRLALATATSAEIPPIAVSQVQPKGLQ